MTVTYGITEEIYSLSGNSRTAYGIAAYADAELDGTATVLASVHDITDSRARILALAEKCNSLKLSFTNLMNAVEDFLTE